MSTLVAPNNPKLAVSSAAATPLRSKDSILNRRGNGCIGYKPSVKSFKSKDLILNRHNPVHKPSVAVFNSSSQANSMSSSNIGAQGFLTYTSRNKTLGASSSRFLGEDKSLAALPSQFFGESVVELRNRLNVLPKRMRSLAPPRASKDNVFEFEIPTITEKPEWWWRTLACVPYLIALQISDVGYFLQPFLERHEAFENLIYFIPGAIRRLPPWFSMIYCYFGFVAVVKNKDLPHYIRFHIMMGMLLETALQLIWCTSNFFPLIHYNGRFGMYYWAGVGFGYILVLLECVRSALSAKYAHIPFISDNAFIHTLHNIGSFQRPF